MRNWRRPYTTTELSPSSDSYTVEVASTSLRATQTEANPQTRNSAISHTKTSMRLADDWVMLTVISAAGTPTIAPKSSPSSRRSSGPRHWTMA